MQLMDSLGFTIHPSKSVLIPSKQIAFVGFILCSETMTVRLTIERKSDLIQCCLDLLRFRRVTIRLFAQLIGKMVAAEPGVEYAPLYYKPLELVKDAMLRRIRGNFDSVMSIPEEIRPIIQWWIANMLGSAKTVTRRPPDVGIYTDASLVGGDLESPQPVARLGGRWSTDEQQCHINVLELKACQLALLSFCKDLTDKHVRVYMDNVTSCAYINKYGGRAHVLNSFSA